MSRQEVGMPFVAIYKDDRIDATALDDDLWDRIHLVRPRVYLACGWCQERMHAKESMAGLRFFAHDRRSLCASARESVAHLALKRIIATTARSVGLTAVVEADSAHHGGSDLWRADVLVEGGGRRIAFEAQLSSMTIDDGRRRTDRYERDGIGAIWVSTRNPQWMGHLPSIHVHEESHDLHYGCAQLVGGPSQWWPVNGISLARFMAAVLAGRLVSAKLRPDVNERPYAIAAHQSIRSTAFVKPESLDEALEQENTHRERVLAAVAGHLDEAERVRTLEELQETLAPQVVADLETQAGPGSMFEVNTHPRGGWQLRSSWVDRGLSIYRTGERRSLAAVVCPSPDSVPIRLAEFWKRTDVVVVVNTTDKAEFLESRLGWPPGSVTVLAPSPVVVNGIEST